MQFPLPEPMKRALELAKQAAAANEVPVGAVIVHDGAIISEAANMMHVTGDPTNHAEMRAIRSALKVLDKKRLTDCDLWVTLEPCAMCAGAISHARIKRLYYAAPDVKGGAVEHGPRFFHQSTCHHQPEIFSGMGEARSSEMLKAFFKNRRRS